MRLRRKKNLIPRLEKVADLLWPEGPSAPPEGPRLCLEIGCGMGGFIAALAAERTEDLFLAAERDQNAAVRAMERVRGLGLDNVRFCVCDAARLPDYLPPGTVSELYLNFSDPWPRRRQAHRRLTHRNYLRLYRALLEPGGVLVFKTDNEPLFRFTEAELASEGWRVSSRDENLPRGPGNVETEYESQFRALGRPIYRVAAVSG